jgi:feruloyl esterase
MKSGMVVVLAVFTRFACAATCDSLTSLSLTNTTITQAQSVAAGAFTPPPAAGRAGGGRGPNFADLPAFCRVQATAKPSADSDIRIEVWLPVATSWNGKLRGTGNGGLGGGTGANPGALAGAMRLGYATVAATQATRAIRVTQSGTRKGSKISVTDLRMK